MSKEPAEKIQSGFASDLGRELRAVRRARGLSIAELARAAGRSVGYISQVERGITEPAVADLRIIAGVFGLPLGWFLQVAEVPEAERGRMTRAGKRRLAGSRESGLVEELVSPDVGGAYEVFRSVFEPGQASDRTIIRQTQETAFMVSGELNIEIAGKKFTVGPGDCFRFENESFRWSNDGAVPAVALWVIAPPVY